MTRRGEREARLISYRVTSGRKIQWVGVLADVAVAVGVRVGVLVGVRVCNVPVAVRVGSPSWCGNGNTLATQFSRAYDTTAPTVLSSLRASPNPTNTAIVNFTVTFSESVTGVNLTDFSLITSGSISGASVNTVSGSGSTYTVTISTGSINGTIRLDVPVSAIITDRASNPLDSLPYTGGETYTITKVFTIFLPLILH